MHPSSPLVEEFKNVPKGHGVNDTIFVVRLSDIFLNPEARSVEMSVSANVLIVLFTSMISELEMTVFLVGKSVQCYVYFVYFYFGLSHALEFFSCTLTLTRPNQTRLLSCLYGCFAKGCPTTA